MTKVLFIGGTGRTGSTVLDRLLGSCPGWLSGGELAFFWRYGIRDGGLCACGEQITKCDVWSKALSLASGDKPVDAVRMIELRRRFWSLHLPLMVLPRFRTHRLDLLEEFPNVVERLYSSAMEVTGSRVLVDSSKDTHYSYILRERTNLDIYFLHMVRDPRAIGHSWQRIRPEKGFEGRVQMERRGIAKTSLYFSVSNIAAETLWKGCRDRYRLLRYEDFVADPAYVCQEIASFVGEDIALEGVLSGFTFQPGAGHTAWGNPNRFDHQPATIRPDNAWRSEQSSWRSHLQGTLVAPIARRYGYRTFNGTCPEKVHWSIEPNQVLGRRASKGASE